MRARVQVRWFGGSVAGVLAVAAALAACGPRDDDTPAPRAGDTHAPRTSSTSPPVAPLPSVGDAWRERGAALAAIETATATKDSAKIRAALDAARAANVRFVDAFRAADWETIDPKADREMLGEGLMRAGADALTRDPPSAVRAFRLLLAKLPDLPVVREVGVYHLPTALLATGDIDGAEAQWTRFADDGDPGARARANLALGDIRSARGDLDAAGRAWAKAGALPTAAPQDDPFARIRREVAARIELVGRMAPEIDVPTWIGGTPTKLSALRGKVVVADFWHTWCEPNRLAMPAFDALHRERAKDGLVVLGVTCPDQRGGFLPKAGSKTPATDGETLKTVAPGDLLAHLRAFRENTAVGYPFLMAPDRRVETDYRVAGYPTAVVIDREGRVAFLAGGSDRMTLLRLVVDRLLATK